MKRKIKSYLAFTSVSYRIVGLLLLPCLLLLFCIGMLRGGGHSISITLYAYVVLYEIMADHWMLGGCLSDGGKGLQYFRTSRAGTEIVGNIVFMDLVRRFLYCMVFTVIVWSMTGQKCDIVNGLAMYCVIVGVLNGSRHIEGIQIEMCIAFLAQPVMVVVSVVHYYLFLSGAVEQGIWFPALAAIYGVAAIGVSWITIRRITRRVWHCSF